jgi:hypothetical protein
MGMRKPGSVKLCGLLPKGFQAAYRNSQPVKETARSLP